MSIAVVITEPWEAPALIGWAWQCARARAADVTVLTPIGKDVPDHGSLPAAVRAAISDRVDGHAKLVAAQQESVGEKPTDPERCPQFEVVELKGTGPESVLAELDTRAIKLLIVAKHERVKGGADSLAQYLFRESKCMVLLIRPGQGDVGGRCRRMLVPTAGGPHATEALKLAAALSDLDDGSCGIDQSQPAGVDALYVEPNLGPDAELVGRRILDRAVRRALGDPKDHPQVRPIVEVANESRAGIATVTERGQYDLVLIGATNQWHARKALFGSVPDKLLKQEDSTLTVGVVRQAVPLMTKTAERLRNVLKQGIPQLDRDDRIALVERIQSASEWNVDFIALICLSTLIATLGLMQDSAAVVIGAMLVAPLMTPLLGCGLAVVQGNGQLIRAASKSVLLGFLLALSIAFFMGLLIPHAGITPQMQSRGAPNALDLAVALVSGIAAAYATARPNLLGALPGVAIAAALVPPIATSGVALAHGDYVTSAGAAMLFLTNIVAIVLGAAMALFAVGMQAQHLHARNKRWIRHATMGLIVGSVILSVPLIYWLYASLPGKELSDELQAVVKQQLADEPDWTLIDVMPPDRSGEVMQLEVVVSGTQPAHAELANEIANALQDESGRPIAVRITTRLTVESATNSRRTTP